jgi:hypothetical protein
LSFRLREELRKRIFENKMLRRIFGSSLEELKRGLRELYMAELHNLYPSPNIIRVIKF